MLVATKTMDTLRRILLLSMLGMGSLALMGCKNAQAKDLVDPAAEAEVSRPIYGTWLLGLSQEEDSGFPIVSYRIENEKLTHISTCVYEDGSAPLTVEVTVPAQVSEDSIRTLASAEKTVKSEDGAHKCTAKLAPDHMKFVVDGQMAALTAAAEDGSSSTLLVQKEE